MSRLLYLNNPAPITHHPPVKEITLRLFLAKTPADKIVLPKFDQHPECLAKLDLVRCHWWMKVCLDKANRKRSHIIFELQPVWIAWIEELFWSIIWNLTEILILKEASVSVQRRRQCLDKAVIGGSHILSTSWSLNLSDQTYWGAILKLEFHLHPYPQPVW